MADPLDRRSSTTSHPSSTRSRRSRSSNPDVFSDDYAADMPLVADGFRPSAPRSNSAPAPDPARSLSLPRAIGRRSIALQPSANDSEGPSKKRPPPQSSIAPGTRSGSAQRNSFSLRHDAQHSDMPRRIPSFASSVTSDPLARPLSGARIPATPRAQSPFNGPQTPSHPYGVDPQNTPNRSSTLPTLRPADSPFSGSHRPTHPYGMYPQDTSAGTMLESVDIAHVGFPGLRQQYQRQIGPEGEEADDIIGPDGHTEQLPPYTRYPEAEPLPRKEAAAAAAAAPAPAPTSARPRSATEPPQTVATGASASDELLPNAAPPTPSTTAVSSNEAASDELPSSKEKWTERSKKRVCGGRLPRWALFLLFGLAIMIAAVLGGVIGKTIPRIKSSSPPRSNATADSDPALNNNS